MTEETFDIIEESNDELENWIYYSNELKTQESNDINSTTQVDTDQQVINFDSTNLTVHDNGQTFQYDTDDSIINNEVLQHNDDQIAEQKSQDNIDTSEHNLMLKESIDENGQFFEEYFCQLCNLTFNTIEDFFSYHPNFQLLNNSFEEKGQQHDPPPELTETKLWDLVENLDEIENGDYEDIETKEEVTQHDVSSEDIKNVNKDIEMEKERYFCYDCKQVFTDLNTAENHDCVNDLQSSNDFTESKSNFVPGNDGNVYRCHLCDKDYTSFRSFNNHQRWHKKSEIILGFTKTLHDEPTVCEICNTIFASKKNLKLHMKMHKKHSIKTIQEALPEGAQSEYNNLNQFFCEICNKSFDQKLLLIHKNMHQNVEEYSCGKCNKNFENLPSYEIHMQMHADNIKKGKIGQKSIETIITEEVPSTSSQGLIHGGKRKHACQYCNKEFQRPYEKVKHERIHTGEKPYECEVCGKTFRVSYSLTLHLRTHTDIRPYVCATCNKRFKQQSVYVHHLKTHDAECAYKCDICGKCFRTSVQLSGHKNIHSKPYNCTECNRPFASLYAVKVHMKTHNKCHKSNKNLKNRCSICGASYARVFALSLHIKEQHGIDVDVKLLAVTTANANKRKKTDTENVLLMNTAHEAQFNFINVDEEEDTSHEADNEDVSMFNSQVDHEENVQNLMPNNVYIDETEAATQTILNIEEISVDNFPAEEIITDWLSK